MRELIRIGEALLVTTGIGGVCLGIPMLTVIGMSRAEYLLDAIAAKLRNNFRDEFANPHGDVPAMPHAFHERTFNTEAS